MAEPLGFVCHNCGRDEKVDPNLAPHLYEFVQGAKTSLTGDYLGGIESKWELKALCSMECLRSYCFGKEGADG